MKSVSNGAGEPDQPDKQTRMSQFLKPLKVWGARKSVFRLDLFSSVSRITNRSYNMTTCLDLKLETKNITGSNIYWESFIAFAEVILSYWFLDDDNVHRSNPVEVLL